MILQLRHDGVRQYGYSVLEALTISNDDMPNEKVDIFHSKP